MNNVNVPFPQGQQLRTPLAQYLRVGEFHRKFGGMHVASHLPTSRAVFETGRLNRQASFAKELKSEGIKITLNTGATKLSSKARHLTFVHHTPWLGNLQGRLLTPKDFGDLAMIGRMAEMAVSLGADRILAPAHFPGDRDFDGLMRVDAEVCAMLRDALDRLGGKHICIDYPVTQTVQGLIKVVVKRQFSATLANLSIDAVWMCLSGLGKEPGPQKIRTFIRMLGGLHNLGKPIVLDYCAGLNGEVAETFSVDSGTAGGILELGQFNARDWNKPPDQPDPDVQFSHARIVPLPGLEKGIRANGFEVPASAKARRKLLLQSGHVSAPSIQEMIMALGQIQALHLVRSQEAPQAIPDLNRTGRFLSKTISDAERRAKDIGCLKPSEAQARALKVDLASLLKRTRDHASTQGKVGECIGKTTLGAWRRCGTRPGMRLQHGTAIETQQSGGDLCKVLSHDTLVNWPNLEA